MNIEANDKKERPGLEEVYSVGSGSSDLRVEADHTSGADVIIAAGLAQKMEPHLGFGFDLMRLRTQWDRIDRPGPMPAALIAEIAAGFQIEEDGENAGFVRVTRGKRKPPLYMTRAQAAQHEASRVNDRALTELVAKLPAFPAVRDVLCAAFYDSLERPEHAVAKVLLWWLEPKCPACGGTKRHVAPGTNRLSGRACGECKGTGQRAIPHGIAGARIMSAISEAKKNATVSIGSRFKHERAPKKAPRPEVYVETGQRWRARDGNLWDVLDVAATTGLLRARRVDGVIGLFKRNGLPRGVLTGPVGSELIESIGSVPS